MGYRAVQPSLFTPISTVRYPNLLYSPPKCKMSWFVLHRAPDQNREELNLKQAREMRAVFAKGDAMQNKCMFKQ